MAENQTIQPSDYEIKRQQRSEEQKRIQRKQATKRTIKIVLISILIAGSIAGLIWYGATRPKVPESDIISKKGLHWHVNLSIEISGKLQEIPTNIGIGVVHNPIHTHDASGEIHLEMGGLVKKDDLRFVQFFKVWGKQFSSTCILDFCNGPNGKVRMLVNGKENSEFENYLMQDKDKIEIKYEAI